MKQTCRSIVSGKPTDEVKWLMNGASFNAAKPFNSLQKALHRADYDVAHRHNRADVQALVAETEAAFEEWRRIRKEDEAQILLTALLFQARWRSPKSTT